ncbi:lactonase family protein [Labilibaculum sp. DW002]|uniref:Lactonase family protein n=1 Tax=Paralabilibaculum antarcticum TaxID=2912572 RepID=A0ABT5VN84_9BACT|nr:lactonase family protein [Labilibaculum sp. DW002]MDE5416868.1 lactonase family protein [Labilibaculum sp. DW002]
MGNSYLYALPNFIFMYQNIILLFASVLLISACKNTKNEIPVNQNNYSFFLGTYTDGESKGIYKVEMDSIGKMKMIGLAAETKNPSFLAFANNQQTLLAVNEISLDNKMGTVETYQVQDSLKLISRKASGGAHPCFVAANCEGVVLTANYTGGNIGYLKVDDEGQLSDLLDVQQHDGKGTHPKRQNEPHAHSVWFQPNSNQIVAADLGTNELWVSSINVETDKFVPANKNKLSLPANSGPRHLAFHPNGKFFFVINELNNTISTFEVMEGKELLLKSSVSTLPADFSEASFTADIHISADGKFLYGSNRGHNSIAIFEVQKDGVLNLLGHESTRGDHPRNFSLSPDDKFLLVANKNANNIVCFKRDQKTGLLSFVDEIKAPSPVCILFKK